MGIEQTPISARCASKHLTRGVLLIFGLSGACGLGYQIVWSRMFASGLGHEWPAVLAMLSAFFGGLALGSSSLDGVVGKTRFPGRWYGGLEVLIGMWGLALIAVIPKAREIGMDWIGLEASPPVHWAISFLVPFFTLLPATVALGATFPAMERFFSRLSGNVKCIGGLYAVNTLGAVLGTAAATFIIIPRIGLGATLWTLALSNILCGICVALVECRAGFSSTCAAERRGFPIAQPSAPALFSPARLRFTVFAAGLLGIAYEVLGVRLLAEVLENTIFSFAAALVVYLTGTVLGAALYQRFESRLNHRATISALLFACAISCLTGAWLLSKAQATYDAAAQALGDGLAPRVAAELIVSLTVFAAPTVFMGALFSHVVQSARRADGGVGRAIAWNLLGGASAPILFGVLLLPFAGAKWALVLAATGYLVLLPNLSRFSSIALPGLLGLLFLIPSNLHSVRAPPGGEILEIREGVLSSVAVIRHFDGNRSLLVNNRFAMGGTGASTAARRHAHIPLLLHDNPTRALFLGVGTGITFGAAAMHKGLQADGVELVPEVLEVRHHFEPFNPLRDGMRLYVADARRFVRASKTRYDVIVADLFHPARDGAGALYTVEHFEAIRKLLTEGGLFCQWLPLFQLDDSMLRVITRAFMEVFPHARAFLLRWNVDTPVLGLIATLDPKIYPPDWFEKRVQDPELKSALEAVTLTDGFHLFGTFLGGAESLAEYSRGAQRNTDDRPTVSFQAPHFAYRRNETSYGRLIHLLDQFSVRAADLIKDDDRSAHFTARLDEYFRARNAYLRGLVADSEGRDSDALDAFVASARLSSEFSAAYAHCLAIAIRQSKTNPSSARRLLERLAEARPERPVASDLIKRLFQEQ